MEKISVDRLFQGVIAQSLRTVGGREPDARQVIGAIPVESRRELSAALLDLLQREVPNGVEYTEASGHAVSPGELRSAFLTQREGGKPKRILFLRVKDAIADSTVPAVALGAAAIFGDPATAIGLKALHVLKVLWDKLVVLSREKDSHSLDAYEALASAIAAMRVKGGGRPTTAELHRRLEGTEIDVLKGALKRLADLQLIEVATWGGAPADLAHDDNAWEIRT